MGDILMTLATIGFGAAGWLAPDWTMKAVGLSDTGSTMGKSDVRAASGALFMVAGLGAILMGGPVAYAMLGCIWLGSALGRATSLVFDGTTTRKWGFFVTEAVFGVMLVAMNLF